MSAKLQVSRAFLDGVKLLLDELKSHPLDKPTQTLCKALENELKAKYEAIERRKAFSEYKQSTPGTKERENARQAFLDQSGIHKDWRSSKEIASSP